MLFLTPDNDFAGEQQDIELDYIKTVRDSMG
jgi:ferredoxin-thioredoxin reductase catalytic chain